MAVELIFLPLISLPHRKFTGSFTQCLDDSSKDCQVFKPDYEWDDIVPHSQSGLTSEPVFVDFFLLQSIFTALSRLTTIIPLRGSHSLVVKILQKPLYTPRKSKRNVRVLLVTDFTVPFPLHLWLVTSDIVDIWDVLQVGDIIAIHKVIWCSEREALYSTCSTLIHNLSRMKREQNVLDIFVKSLQQTF